MNESDTSDNTSDTTEESTTDHGHNTHVIFVDGTGETHQQTYEKDVIEAVTIIEEAGYDEDPETYILEALRGESGAVDEEFDPQGEAGPNEVKLTEKHRKFFQVTTRGEPFK